MKNISLYTSSQDVGSFCLDCALSIRFKSLVLTWKINSGNWNPGCKEKHSMFRLQLESKATTNNTYEASLPFSDTNVTNYKTISGSITYTCIRNLVFSWESTVIICLLEFCKARTFETTINTVDSHSIQNEKITVNWG